MPIFLLGLNSTRANNFPVNFTAYYLAVINDLASGMSSNKEERKAQAREEKAIDKAIEETKDSASKIIREVRKDVVENTATFHDYQEQNLRAVRDMTGDFLDSQKEVAKSLQSAYRPISSNAFLSMIYWPFSAMISQTWAENYVKAATNFAEMTVAAVRLQNELTAETMEATRQFTETARKNTKELGQLNVENARAIEQMLRSVYGTASAP